MAGKLAEYQCKRRFGKTSEPRGASRGGQSGAAQFVIQKHDASSLHYDFRIEVDGC